MKNIFLFLLIFLHGAAARSQFISNGKITFERQTNLKMSMRVEYSGDQDNSWVSEMIARSPKYKNSYFTLSFNENKSDYRFDHEDETKTPFGGSRPANKNSVISDFKEQRTVSSKEIYESTFLITDSFPHLSWKIEDEIRMIAGYACRKAVTQICDSVVVVAFYTEQIMVSGGPESFKGLPGMILGIAVPRLYTTWFATSVELDPFDDTQIKELKKGDKVSVSKMNETLTKSVGKWGDYGQTMIWWANL